MSRRDKSPSPDRKKSKKLKYDRDSKNRDLEKSEFSYLRYKYKLDRLLNGHHPNDRLIDDIFDFWKFVEKYEATIKKRDKLAKGGSRREEVSEIARRSNFILISPETRTRNEHLIDIDDERSDLTRRRIDTFYDIIRIYLDFKQKQRFAKLEKLRQCQKSLPVYKFREQILDSVATNQVTIVAGDTGCGKSTQIPQYLHKHGFKNIVCTQPRRLACIALSKRVAHEMLCEYGTKVGYQIRFEKHKNKETAICFITEGLLLRQLTSNEQLDQYDVIILDEIHERNLHGDFLLGVAKCLLRARPDLKLILMSATINVELFAKFFEEERTELIEVPGRLYPIKTYYMPPVKMDMGTKSRQKDERLNPEPYIQIMNLIDEKYPVNEKGDMLIFVSGVNEIDTVIEAAKNYSEKQNHWLILPLHSGLSLTEQDKVFAYAEEGMRKCIVSTNIAETSVTVDGVRFVVDSGKMKEMIYDASSKLQRLKEFWVSKSSAEQRKGRAGRTGPGICYRVYSQQDFDKFESYSTPEICRVPLDSMLLQMVAMGLPNVRLFPFIESPTKENIEQAVLSLKQHGAIGPDEKITTLGKALSKLPVDISIGKMLLMGCVFEELQRVLTLAAGLSIQSPFTNRAFRSQKCEIRRKDMQSDQGDPLTLLNMFKEWLDIKWRTNENTRKWCHEIGVEEQRFYELSKLRNQFENILKDCNIIKENPHDKNLSSAERAARHGEVRTLRALKRAHAMSSTKKTKILKQKDVDGDENFDDSERDIRDVEFRLSNDSRRLDNLIRSASARSHREVLVLKLILVSGLYPQIAIPDEFNYCKSASQQFFHTFLKPFVSIHPNGQFANMTDILKLADSDIIDRPPYYTSKSPLSSAHQILCYQNLLETTKPYLLNVIRMPAAQTLLLFSLAIDTNLTASKIVCDSWLCLEFPFPEQGLHILEKAIHIRSVWHKMLSEKLSEPLSAEGTPDKRKSHSSHREQADFMNDLATFMKVDICYTLKRLLPADLKEIYRHDFSDEHKLSLNPFVESYEMTPNTNKGGVNVTDNVVYGCLRETPWSLSLQEELLRIEWSCENCGQEIELIGISKLVHKKQCVKPVPSTQDEEEKQIDDKQASTSGNLKKYSCDVCNRTLHMTSIEILKHKRSCKK